MAGLKVVWTATATIVLHQTLTFYRVRNRSSKYSRSMYRMINDILKLVAKYPYMYKATTVPGIRVFHCDYCRVYYSNSSLKFEIKAKRLYAASQRVL